MSLEKYFKLQEKIEKMSNPYNSLGLERAMHIANKFNHIYDSEILSQVSSINNAQHYAAIQISPLLQQIQTQYKFLERFNIPINSYVPHLHDHSKMQMYFQNIMESVNWQTLELDRSNYEQYSDLVEELTIDESPITPPKAQSDTPISPKKAINYITLLTLIFVTLLVMH